MGRGAGHTRLTRMRAAWWPMACRAECAALPVAATAPAGEWHRLELAAWDEGGGALNSVGDLGTSWPNVAHIVFRMSTRTLLAGLGKFIPEWRKTAGPDEAPASAGAVSPVRPGGAVGGLADSLDTVFRKDRPDVARCRRPCRQPRHSLPQGPAAVRKKCCARRESPWRSLVRALKLSGANPLPQGKDRLVRRWPEHGLWDRYVSHGPLTEPDQSLKEKFSRQLMRDTSRNELHSSRAGVLRFPVPERHGESRHQPARYSTGQVRPGHPASMVSVGFSRIACTGIKTLLRSGIPPQQAALRLNRRLSYTRSELAAIAVGRAQAPRDVSVAHSRSRVHAGRPIGMPVHCVPSPSCADGNRSGAAGRLASNHFISIK